MPITEADLIRQEERFALAFEAGDLEIARPLYDDDVVYVSPTVRLFGWPKVIEGVNHALGFVALTIGNCVDIRYRAVETAISSGGESAFARIHFDWSIGERRVRSNYVVIYRYREGRIIRQELYYDPSGELETL